MALKPNIQTSGSSGLDWVKLAFAVAVIVFGVGQFYYYGTHPLSYNGAPHSVPTVYRLLVLLVAIGVGIFVARYTAIGSSSLRYLKTAWVEVQKMVWPSRQQTAQATIAVIVLVVLLGVFMWVVDLIVETLFRGITGQ